MLEHALAAAAAMPSERTVLVLGAYADEIEAGIDLGDASVVRCEDWAQGQGASLAAGLDVLGTDVDAALVTLGDEPFVSPEAGRRLLAARRPGLAASRAAYAGLPGHPVLIERELFGALTAAPPELGPAALLREAGIEMVECGDLGHPVDVDLPEHLAKLQREGE